MTIDANAPAVISALVATLAATAQATALGIGAAQCFYPYAAVNPEAGTDATLPIAVLQIADSGTASPWSGGGVLKSWTLLVTLIFDADTVTSAQAETYAEAIADQIGQAPGELPVASTSWAPGADPDLDQTDDGSSRRTRIATITINAGLES